MSAGMFGSVIKEYYSMNKTGKIQKKTKVDGAVIINEFDYYEGPIVGIEISKGIYESKPVYKLLITFLEDFGKVLFTCGAFTFAGKDIINKLCNCPDYSFIRITPFVSKDEKASKDYVRASIRHHNEKITPKYLKDSIPTVKTGMFGRQTVIDDSEQNDFYANLVIDIANKISEERNSTYNETVIEEEE
jgi:hypothetical protein